MAVQKGRSRTALEVREVVCAGDNRHLPSSVEDVSDLYVRVDHRIPQLRERCVVIPDRACPRERTDR